MADQSSSPKAEVQADQRPDSWLWLAGLLAVAVFGGGELDNFFSRTGRTFPVLLTGGGFCLPALLLSPLRRWPWLLLAAGLATVLSHGWLPGQTSQTAALLVANLLSAVLIGAAVRFSGRWPSAPEFTLGAAGWFMICSGVIWGAVIAPICAALSLTTANSEFGPIWGRWFTSGLTGLWLITPPLIEGWRNRAAAIGQNRPGRVTEAALLVVTLGIACIGIFTGAIPMISLPSLLSMWAIWAVLRFGMVGGASAMLTIALFALSATMHNEGPFVRPDRTVSESLLRLLVYLAVWAGFLQIIAAIQQERGRAVRSLAELNQELEERVAERTQSLSQTASALRESEERFRLAAEAAGFGAYDHWLETGELHWSPEMKAIYGLAPGAPIVGTELLERFFVPEERQRVRAAYERSLDPAGTGTLEVEHRIRPHGGGPERWVRVSGRTLFAPAGEGRKPVRAIGTCMDITERKQAEEALRESENRLALAVKAGHSGTFDWDARTDTNIWSDDLLALYGIERSEFRGRYADWLECVHPEDRAMAEARIQESFVTGQFILQARIRRRDNGAVRWMEGRGTLLTDSEGKPARLLGINVDITEQKVVEEALRESEQRMQFVLQAVNVGVWSIDLPSGVLTASAECRRNFGVREGDDFASYKDVLARIHPDDRAAEAAAATEARARHGEYEAEYRVSWPDGSTHWILARGQADRDGAGKATRLSGIALDITERKEVEQALKDSESRLRSYYEAAPLFMGLVELDGEEMRHLYDNPASCRFFGMLAKEGKNGSGFELSPAAQDLWRRHYRLSATRGEPVRFELSLPMPAGERWLSITVTPLPESSGGPPRFSYVAEDVTSRRRTEMALRQHATRQATLLELTRTILSKRADAHALGIAIFQRVSGVLEADIGFNYRLEDGVLRLVAGFGIPPEQMAGARELGIGEAFCGAVAESSAPLMAEAARIACDPRGEFVRSLGARAYACHPLLSSEGRTLGTLSFASTRRERFEPEEVSFLQTLSHYVAIAWERSAAEAAMQKAKEAAEGASRAKDEFLAALSHELRTPLNPVLLLASELQRNPDLSEEVRGDLGTIRRNVELEARLIDDLLDLTRITRGKVHLDLRPVEVHRVLQEALDILGSELSARQLSLTLELKAETTAVQGDAVRLQQVFWNLLRNAIKFTPPGGSVVLRTCEIAPGRLRVEVRDTGEGISPVHLRTIFEIFNQGEGGHRFGGLGLGLAIARSLVEMHGGKISAESPGRGHGATFGVELPLMSTAGAAAPAIPPVAPAAERVPALPSLRILLVEDHEPTRLALTRLLERRRHTVTPAGTLAAARGFAGTNRFDLLISDLGLPDGDGTELMRQFAADGGPPGIALSGYGMDEDLQRTTAAGFFAHLVKPVDVDLLERTLSTWSRDGRA